MNMNIEGAMINDSIVEILKEWQLNDNVPVIHIEKLCRLQDFFCRLLINNCPDIENNIINEFLMDIINIKDDLRMFNLEKPD